MNTPVDDLVVIGKILALGSKASSAQKAQLETLRAGVPPSVLAHYLRSLACGRRGVAVVRHGVCGECHLRVPHATVFSLIQPTDLHLCENCGCFLTLDPEERETQATRVLAVPTRPVARRSPRKAASGMELASTSGLAAV